MTINQTTVGYQPQFVSAQRDLQNRATEIVNNIWLYQHPSGSLPNYATNSTPFTDSASTALLASVAYRVAALPTYLRGPNSRSTEDPSITNTQPAINATSLAPPATLTDASILAAHRARDFVKNNLNDTDGLADQCGRSLYV